MQGRNNTMMTRVGVEPIMPRLEFIDILEISFMQQQKSSEQKTSHACQTPVVQQQCLYAPNTCA